MKKLVIAALVLAIPLAASFFLFGESQEAVPETVARQQIDSPRAEEPAADAVEPAADAVEPPTSEDEQPPVVRRLYIGNTGGVGVALRGSCADVARTQQAWPEGTLVDVINEGVDGCDGWVLVENDGAESWVRGGFLSPTAPRLFAAPTAPTTSPPPTATVPSASGGGCSPSSGGTQHAPAPSSILPFLAYGSGLCGGAVIEVLVAGASCGTTTVTATGNWVFAISAADRCQPAADAIITFRVNGVLSAATEVYSPGGVPADYTHGVDLS